MNNTLVQLQQTFLHTLCTKWQNLHGLPCVTCKHCTKYSTEPPWSAVCYTQTLHKVFNRTSMVSVLHTNLARSDRTSMLCVLYTNLAQSDRTSMLSVLHTNLAQSDTTSMLCVCYTQTLHKVTEPPCSVCITHKPCTKYSTEPPWSAVCTNIASRFSQ